MAYDDLPLGRPSQLPPSPPARGSTASRWIIAAAAVIVAAGGLYFWWLTRQPPAAPTPPPTPGSEAAVGTNRPKRQPIELPSLDQSDTLVRDLASTLSRHPLLARFLATPAIVRGVVLAVEQIGDGKTPVKPLKVFQPPTRLAIIGSESGRIDPGAYVRWEGDVVALTSVRPVEAAQLYVNLKPLFDAAYIELGHPEGDFDASLVRALRMLDTTPEPAAEPVLLKRNGFYEHQDDALRALKPVQKEMLLLGTERRSRVRGWLNAFASALDLKIAAG